MSRTLSSQEDGAQHHRDDRDQVDGERSARRSDARDQSSHDHERRHRCRSLPARPSASERVPGERRVGEPDSPNGAVQMAASASIRAMTGSDPYRCVSGRRDVDREAVADHRDEDAATTPSASLEPFVDRRHRDRGDPDEPHDEADGLRPAREPAQHQRADRGREDRERPVQQAGQPRADPLLREREQRERDRDPQDRDRDEPRPILARDRSRARRARATAPRPRNARAAT